jgi:hypothetical protein
VKKRSEEVALFRFGVIGDLVHLPPGAKGLYERLKEKATCPWRAMPRSPGACRDRSSARWSSSRRWVDSTIDTSGLRHDDKVGGAGGPIRPAVRADGVLGNDRADYVAICVPAFSPEKMHRDPG